LAYDNVARLGRARFEGVDDQQLVDALLTDWMTHTVPLVRAATPILCAEPSPGPQGVWTWWAGFAIKGDRELLQFWPDGFPNPYRSGEPGIAGSTTWQESADGVIAFMSVPADDDPDGAAVPRDRILAATRFLDDLLQAINDQVAQEDAKLRTQIAVDVATRRERLRLITERNAMVIYLLPRPRRPLQVHSGLLTNEASPPEAEPSGSESVPATDPAHVDLGPVLRGSTFRDLVEVTLRWRDAVENYPTAFAPLDEETLSSLLVATLNVAFDTAQREVYRCGGKTDIYVEARRGDREQAAFFGEAKVWRGPKRVAEAVDQVLRYSNARTAHAMLLYYVHTQELGPTQAACHEALRKTAPFASWTTNGPTGEDALLRHPSYGSQLMLAPVFIHLPPQRLRTRGGA